MKCFKIWPLLQIVRNIKCHSWRRFVRLSCKSKSPHSAVIPFVHNAYECYKGLWRWLVHSFKGNFYYWNILWTVFRSRKTGSMSMVSYLASGFVYAKVAHLVLFFRADPRLGLVYLLIFIIQVRKSTESWILTFSVQTM